MRVFAPGSPNNIKKEDRRAAILFRVRAWHDEGRGAFIGCLQNVFERAGFRNCVIFYSFIRKVHAPHLPMSLESGGKSCHTPRL